MMVKRSQTSPRYIVLALTDQEVRQYLLPNLPKTYTHLPNAQAHNRAVFIREALENILAEPLIPHPVVFEITRGRKS